MKEKSYVDCVDEMITTSVTTGTGCMEIFWDKKTKTMGYKVVDIRKSRKEFAIDEIKRQPFFS